MTHGVLLFPSLIYQNLGLENRSKVKIGDPRQVVVKVDMSRRRRRDQRAKVRTDGAFVRSFVPEYNEGCTVVSPRILLYILGVTLGSRDRR